jgi:hypothetical protein
MLTPNVPRQPVDLAVAAANEMPKLGGLVDPTRAAWVVVDALRKAGWLHAPVTIHIHGQVQGEDDLVKSVCDAVAKHRLTRA